LNIFGETGRRREMELVALRNRFALPLWRRTVVTVRAGLDSSRQNERPEAANAANG